MRPCVRGDASIILDTPMRWRRVGGRLCLRVTRPPNKQRSIHIFTPTRSNQSTKPNRFKTRHTQHEQILSRTLWADVPSPSSSPSSSLEPPRVLKLIDEAMRQQQQGKGHWPVPALADTNTYVWVWVYKYVGRDLGLCLDSIANQPS